MSFSEHLRFDPNFLQTRKGRSLYKRHGEAGIGAFMILLCTGVADAPDDGFLKDYTEQDVKDLFSSDELYNAIIDTFLIKVEGGYQIHEWKLHQPYFAQKKERIANASKGGKASARKRAAQREADQEQADSSTGSSTDSQLPVQRNSNSNSNSNINTNSNTNTNCVISQNIQNLLFKAFGTTHNGRTEDWLSVHGEDHVADALKITIDKKAKSPNYTQSILDSWLKEGYPEDREKQEADDYNEYVKMIAERDSDD